MEATTATRQAANADVDAPHGDAGGPCGEDVVRPLVTPLQQLMFRWVVGVPSDMQSVERHALTNVLRRTLLEDTPRVGFSCACHTHLVGEDLFLRGRRWRRNGTPCAMDKDDVPTIWVKDSCALIHDEKLCHRISMLPLSYTYAPIGGDGANDGAPGTRYAVDLQPVAMHVQPSNAFNGDGTIVATTTPPALHLGGGANHMLASHTTSAASRRPMTVEALPLLGCPSMQPGFSHHSIVRDDDTDDADQVAIVIDPVVPVSEDAIADAPTLRYLTLVHAHLAWACARTVLFAIESVTGMVADRVAGRKRHLEIDVGPNVPICIESMLRHGLTLLFKQMEHCNDERRVSADASPPLTIRLQVHAVRRNGSRYALTLADQIPPCFDQHELDGVMITEPPPAVTEEEQQDDGRRHGRADDDDGRVRPFWSARLYRAHPYNFACVWEDTVVTTSRWNLTVHNETHTLAYHFQVWCLACIHRVRRLRPLLQWWRRAQDRLAVPLLAAMRGGRHDEDEGQGRRRRLCVLADAWTRWQREPPPWIGGAFDSVQGVAYVQQSPTDEVVTFDFTLEGVGANERGRAERMVLALLEAYALYMRRTILHTTLSAGEALFDEGPLEATLQKRAPMRWTIQNKAGAAGAPTGSSVDPPNATGSAAAGGDGTFFHIATDLAVVPPPIRCITCGKTISGIIRHYHAYKRRQAQKEGGTAAALLSPCNDVNVKRVLEASGVVRGCCKSRIITQCTSDV